MTVEEATRKQMEMIERWRGYDPMESCFRMAKAMAWMWIVGGFAMLAILVWFYLSGDA